MNRPRIFRLLSLAASVVCLIACVTAIALWVRSYRSVDIIFGCVYETRPFTITSERGRLHLLVSNVSRGRGGGSGFFSYVIGEPIQGSPPKMGVVSAPSNWSMGLPYWLFILLIGAVAVLLLRASRPRFSLRALLIATTFIAILLGLVVGLR